MLTSFRNAVLVLAIGLIVGCEAKEVAKPLLANQPASSQSTQSFQNQTSYPVAKGLPNNISINCSHGVTMDMVLIPAGKYMMGSPDNEQDRDGNEGPQHLVTIIKPFYLGKYKVTRAQWFAVMGRNPNRNNDDDNLPMEKISWHDCQEFCKLLSAITGNKVRLPSEAEWEYACRAGTTTRFYYGDDPDYKQLHKYAWFLDNPLLMHTSDARTHTVGQKMPNAWGLFDMCGNTWEWCQDCYYSNYEGAPVNGSARDITPDAKRDQVFINDTSGQPVFLDSYYRILRGCGKPWEKGKFFRSASRNKFLGDYSKWPYIGCRVVLELSEKP